MRRCESARSLSILAFLVIAGLTSVAAALDWPQWRGPARNGISKETGLLKSWPKEGPKLLWKKSDIGAGYSTPAVVGDRLYLLSNDGLENEFVAAHSTTDGSRLWTARLGKVGNPDQRPSFPAARSTPTVVGDLLYALGSNGDLACIETETGAIRWRKDLRADLGGKPGPWAYSESPLVDGDTVVATPGGSEATMVALERGSGKLVWKCPISEGDQAAFASAIIVEEAGVKQYVQLLQKGLVGVEAKSGKLLWRYKRPISQYGANIPTPVAGGGIIYVGSAGTGGGAVRLKKTEAGVEAEELYFESKLPTAIGGTVKLGDSLFGTTSQSMMCIEFATGKIKWQDRALGAASLCCADGLLYLHAESGDAALVEVSESSYQERGRFTPPDQPKRRGEMERAWAYPVVASGRLYLRDHDVLWCYDVRDPSAK
jgi:outer membrane protein assembly factor BamB